MMGAVIFDMDGVLVDSEAMYQYLLLDFFKKQGQHITVREANAFVGCSDSFFYRHMGMLWKPRLTETDMRKLFSQRFGQQELNYTTLLNPHVRYILPQIKQAGLQVAIASSSAKNRILDMMNCNEIASYIDQVISGHEVAISKPDPAIYHETLRRLALPGEQCVVIEDSAIGIEAAKRAGLYVIAKREIRFEVDQSKADYIADDLLQAWLHIESYFHLS